MRRRRLHDLLDESEDGVPGESLAGVLVRPGPQLVVQPFVPVAVDNVEGKEEQEEGREWSTNSSSMTIKTYARI